METETKKAFTWEIDNFSERKDVIMSDTFSSGGCEWCLCVYPKGNFVDDHLSLFLFAVNPGSLLPGWSRRAISRFVLLNQSRKELHITVDKRKLFCSETPGLGFHRMLPLSKFQEEGFLENNKLIIEVYIKVLKVVHQGKSTENEIVSFNGFHILNTQAISVTRIFAQHPDIAVDVRSKIREVKTAYMNILLGLIETLNKPPQSLSETELSNVDSELRQLTEAGFKLDWLKSKREDVSLVRKKAVSDDGHVQKLEERVKNVELASDKDDTKTSAVAATPKVFSFEFIDCFVKRFFLSCFSISNH